MSTVEANVWLKTFPQPGTTVGKKSEYSSEQMYYQSQKPIPKKTPNQIIPERLQKVIRADSALLGKRSAESTLEYFLWVPKGPRMSGQAAGER